MKNLISIILNFIGETLLIEAGLIFIYLACKIKGKDMEVSYIGEIDDDYNVDSIVIRRER